jgi:uncharacterized damage-inducible protein DinB
VEAEPWLRGAIEHAAEEIPAHVMPVFFSFAQVREDLAEHTAEIGADALWCEMAGRHSLGYHLKHIAGSVDRLTSYLAGRPLSEEQLTFLSNEHRADASLDELLMLVHTKLHEAEQQILQVKVEAFFEARVVGRQELPTTVLGLLVHICEHTQRHLGQAILISKLLRDG